MYWTPTIWAWVTRFGDEEISAEQVPADYAPQARSIGWLEPFWGHLEARRSGFVCG